MHPHMTVVGLREGSLLHVHKDQMELIGKDMTIFRRGSEPEVITAGTKLRIDLRPLAPAH